MPTSVAQSRFQSTCTLSEPSSMFHPWSAYPNNPHQSQRLPQTQSHPCSTLSMMTSGPIASEASQRFYGIRPESWYHSDGNFDYVQPDGPAFILNDQIPIQLSQITAHGLCQTRSPILCNLSLQRRSQNYPLRHSSLSDRFWPDIRPLPSVSCNGMFPGYMKIMSLTKEIDFAVC